MGINNKGGVMKRVFKVLILVFLVAIIFFTVKNKKSFNVYDEENNKLKLTLKKPFYKKFYNEVEISNGANSKTQIFDGKMTLNIWKVETGLVNDKTNFDIIFGVYSVAPHHKVFAKRVFIYNIKDLKLKPKFRCSRLVSPMIDFSIFDWNGDGYDEIISIEKYKDIYSFNVYVQYDFNIKRIYTKKLDFIPQSFLKRDGKLYISSNTVEKEVYVKNKEVYFK